MRENIYQARPPERLSTVAVGGRFPEVCCHQHNERSFQVKAATLRNLISTCHFSEVDGASSTGDSWGRHVH